MNTVYKKTVENDVSPLFITLKEKIKGDISCSYQTLASHSVDNSNCQVWPQAVVFPKTVNDIKEIIDFAKEYNMPISPRGNGSLDDGGSLTEGIHLDMTKYFSEIKTINVINSLITVESGVSNKYIKEKLKSWGLEIPIITEENETGTIGGLVSSKHISSSFLEHGSIREWVEGINIVLSNKEEHQIRDGVAPSSGLLEIYEKTFPLISRNLSYINGAKNNCRVDNSGFDIWNQSISGRQLIDIIVGSGGTLGIITSITLRTTPIKRKEVSLLLEINSYKDLQKSIDILKDAGLERVNLIDTNSIILAGKNFESITKEIKLKEDTKFCLLGTLRANDEERLEHKAKIILSKIHLDEKDKRILNHEEASAYKKLVSSPKEILSIYSKKRLPVINFLDSLIVEVSQVSNFIKELEEILQNKGMTFLISGNVAFGHVSILFIYDISNDEMCDKLFLFTRDIFSLTKKYNGGICGYGNDGLIRTPFLNVMYGSKITELFNEIKNIWDAENIFNPSKKTYASLSYLKQHLRKIN